uniref:Uncharacterized protein n=1 Tax=Kwoniella bestiolae CBS 10118 TaxID=1296100 RepID=A0A1B9FYI9_9TREE|nr:hypothetical protein I302_06813 [Kwoniella bestiolae CBS 10118]OCF23829.1 hypothetical protein I302_06813 [Kwoniella bestiolae CBS 10118]
MTASIIYRSTACSQIRSFCSTCHLLFNHSPPRLGEPSRARPTTTKLRTRAGILSKATKKPRSTDREDTSTKPLLKDGYGALRSNRNGISKSEGILETSGKVNWKDAIRNMYPNSHSEGKTVEPAINVDPEARIRIIGFDLSTSLPTIFKTRTQIFRSPLFNLRCIPFTLLPPRKIPPFPTETLHDWRNEQKGGCVYFSAIGSKNAVSKLAVERNRSRRRFNAVLEGVLNERGEMGGMNSGERRGLVDCEYAYIASLTSSLHDAPFTQIQQDILQGLKYLKQRQSQREPRSQSFSRQVSAPLPRYIPRGKLGDTVLPTQNDQENMMNRIL